MKSQGSFIDSDVLSHILSQPLKSLELTATFRSVNAIGQQRVTFALTSDLHYLEAHLGYCVNRQYLPADRDFLCSSVLQERDSSHSGRSVVIQSPSTKHFCGYVSAPACYQHHLNFQLTWEGLSSCLGRDITSLYLIILASILRIKQKNIKNKSLRN